METVFITWAPNWTNVIKHFEKVYEQMKHVSEKGVLWLSQKKVATVSRHYPRFRNECNWLDRWKCRRPRRPWCSHCANRRTWKAFFNVFNKEAVVDIHVPHPAGLSHQNDRARWWMSIASLPKLTLSGNTTQRCAQPAGICSDWGACVQWLGLMLLFNSSTMPFVTTFCS